MSNPNPQLDKLTPEQRALLQRKLLARRAAASANQITPRDRTQACPLSFGQELMWLLDQLTTGVNAYNVIRAMRIHGLLQVEALQRALDEVLRRHEVLRTTYQTIDGLPVQVIAPPERTELKTIDLGHVPPADRDAEVMRLAIYYSDQRFDLARDIPFRKVLLRLADDDHVLILVSHHIASDGWSKGVMFRELETLYGAFTSGQPSPLTDLPIQYADFAVWQRNWLQGERYQKLLDYWKQQLQGAPEVLQLPLDFSRPEVPSGRGRKHGITLDRSLSNGLTELARREGCTMFMLGFAAFQTLMHRYSGQTDVVVGTPISGRTLSQIEPLIGYFSNSIALRTDFSGDPTFRELLARVREVALGAYSHQDMPFEKLVVELNSQRSLSITPIYQVMFAVGVAQSDQPDLPGLSVEPIFGDRETTKFDLTGGMRAVDDCFRVGIEYSTDLFTHETAERLLENFRTLLAGIVAQPGQRVSQLPLLPAAERQQLLVEWSGARAADDARDVAGTRPPLMGIPERFARQAQQRPDHVAVVSGDAQLTYRELDERANQLAQFLRQRGARPGRVIGLCLERSLEMIVSVLAVYKTGAAYLALDPDYPRDRLEHMIQEAALAAVITTTSLQDRLPAGCTDFIFVDADAAAIAAQPAVPPETRFSPALPAYVVFTSGTTGRSKGVLVSHASLANAYAGWEAAYELSVDDIHLQMASFSFDVFAGDFVRGLASGATLILCPREILLDPANLFDLLRKKQVTCAEFVPAVLRELVHYLKDSQQNLGFMRLLIAGSDVWRTDEFRQVKQLCGAETRVINSYGIAEATIDSTFFEGEPAGIADDGPVPIGRPFANTEIYILDAHLEPVPRGISGELYIGGPGLAYGYLNATGQTASKFVPHPFSSRPGDRLYKTGDLARYRIDGTIEFLGRSDFQVKLRGFRIELGEIEAALCEHPQVRQAIVALREDSAGNKRLVAYFEPAASGAPAPASELREMLRSRLPDYMVPTVFVPLDKLPLTPNGKVDRKSLPEPDLGQATDETTYVAPRNPLEEGLAALWSELLNIPQVGIHDNFFELGGHSLLAARLVSRIRSTLKCELEIRTIFEAPTIAQLAGRLNTGGPRRTPLVRQVRPERLPLSAAQSRLWFLHRLEGPSATYNIPLALRLEGELNVPALQAAVADLVTRHESLRTVFPDLEGEPYQQILSATEAQVPWSHESVTEAALPERLSVATATSIDLCREIPLRAWLFRLGERQHVLLLLLHHIAGDGWSFGPLARDLTTAYTARSRGQAPAWVPLAVQYADYTLWQQACLGTPEDPDSQISKQIEFWRNALADIPEELTLPVDHPRPAELSYRGAHAALQIDEALHRRLLELAQQNGASLFMVLQAALVTLLSRQGAGTDIPIGTPIAGRNEQALEDLIGFFVNTLVLRASAAGNPTFRELIQRVRTFDLEAYTHQDLPFEQLVEILQPTRSPSRHPLFQVMLVLQNAPREKLDLAGLKSQTQPFPREIAKFDLLLGLYEQQTPQGEPRGIAGGFSYSTDLFEADTIQSLAGRLVRILEQVTQAPETPIQQLEILTPTERRQLLVEFNNTATDAPLDRCVHQLFEDQVERTPDALAVVFAGEQLTYSQLNAAANRLARQLRHLGVGPDSLVAICLERGIPLVTGILAILKAGGAYVPLDPAYPEERLQVMLDDARAAVLLTQASMADRLPATRHVIRWETDIPGLPPVPHNLPVLTGPTNLAYVLYTSGSTGKPKGVAMEHRSLVNLVQWQIGESAAREGARTLQFASANFDVSFQEIFATWCVGGTLVLVDEELRLDPTLLLRYLARERVERLFVPFVALQQIADAGSGADLDDLPLREIITAGEQLRVTPQLTTFLAKLPQCRLYNEYGPTEAHVVTAHALGAEPDAWPPLPPIGKPIANAEIYILDALLQPVPLGVAGELCIGGVCNARGYLGRPDLTAEKFVPHPFDGTAGGRLYRTGDLARWKPDGTVECLGRIDQQVKLRGYRIELGDIETALCQHPQVRQAVVILREDLPGEKRLVAYFEPVASDAPPAAAELRDSLLVKLPEYMVPTIFVPLAALPLTPSGKVNRRALPVPDLSRVGGAALPVAPRTPVEELLAGIWCEILRLDVVGIHDNFFELGGHSLLAVRLASRVRATLNTELPIKTIFEGPTIAEMALRLHDHGAQRAPLVKQARPARLPLSAAQTRLWFLHRLEGPSATYNIPLALRLAGEVNVPALQAAVTDLVTRHESLRTVFPDIQGEPYQHILSATEAQVHWSLETATEADLPARLSGAAATGIDLCLEIPLRVWLFKLSEREHVLLLLLHHIAGDGWSLGPLSRDLTTAYAARSRGQAPAWSPLAVQYADYTLWQQACLGTPDNPDSQISKQIAFWRKALADIPEELSLPTDRPRPAELNYRGAQVPVQLDAALHRRLLTLAQQNGASLFMVFQAALVTLLSRQGAGTDIPIGTPIAGRGAQALEDLIGFFVNTLVLRTDVAGNPTFRELIQRVRAFDLEAYDHQDLPFEQLVETLQPTRSPSRHPLFQVMLVLQNAPREKLELTGLTFQPQKFTREVAKFDLLLGLIEQLSPRGEPLGISGGLNYSTALFDVETIRGLASRLVRILEQAAQTPDLPIEQLEILTPAERQQLLVDFNQTTTAAPLDRCVHQLFEDQVEQTPDSVAVCCGPQQVTYRELNARANRLAHDLRHRGVGPDVTVALCLDRSVELIVGILGILKAGGTYVPLDPVYPRERVRFLLADSRARLLLTQAEFRDTLPTGDLTVLCLDQDPAPASPDAFPNLPCQSSPSSLAYMIYTSGSTGQPKGVVVPHRAIVRLVRNTNYLPFDDRQRFLLLASPAFDASTLELWGPLLNGATCVVYPPRVPEFDDLARTLREQRISCLWLTSSLFNSIVDNRLDMLAGVTHLLTGGEALSVDHVRRYRERFPDTHLVDGYGPTECTTFACTYAIPAEIGPDWSSIPIGQPIANTEAYVLDNRLQPVPVGIPGELYLGGAGLARGYWNHPELTAEKFVAHPFSTAPGARLYRTGDLVRWRRDGNLEFLGRIDQQIKLRGFRIELGEIEATLRQHPQIAQAVVVLRDHPPAGKHLVAYLVPTTPGQGPRTGELRSELGERLPEYMIPSAFVELEKLPLTPNGKLDHRALPAPDRGDRTSSEQDYVAPRNPREVRMAALWESVLNTRVGIYDSFFALGGHSLLAIKLFAEIEVEFGTRLPLHVLFKTPTVAALTEWIQAGAVKDTSLLVPIQPSGNRPPLFVVHSLEGELLFWEKFLPDLGPDQPVYGLRPPFESDTAITSFEQMADRYATELVTEYPTGSFRIAGYSFGGPLAFEIARNLEQRGRAVSFLGLIDAVAKHPSQNRWPTPAGLVPYLRNLRHWIADDVRKSGRRELLKRFGRWSRTLIRRPSRNRSRLADEVADAFADQDRDWTSDRKKIAERFMTLMAGYVPQKYRGQVTLYRIRGLLPRLYLRYGPDMGWRSCANQIDIKIIANCKHHRMIREPFVRDLASSMRTALDRTVQQ